MLTTGLLAAALLIPATGHAEWRVPQVLLKPPASVQSAGSGYADLQLMRDRIGEETVCWVLSFETPQRPYGIFLRRDRTGAPDPAVLKISTAPHNPLPWPGGASMSGCGRVARGVVAAIRTAPARYYLDIPTPRYPRGELRARLRGPVVRAG
jgi:hypothetical protein